MHAAPHLQEFPLVVPALAYALNVEFAVFQYRYGTAKSVASLLKAKSDVVALLDTLFVARTSAVSTLF